MSDCIFCKIVEGEIPAAKVFEDNACIAFLDIMPANKGHVLVVPKEHHETFSDLPEKAINDVFLTGQKVAEAVKKATGCAGYNILMNAGKEAGQVVMHSHLHVIPRFSEDGVKFDWAQKKYEEGEMDSFKEKIMKELE